MSVSLNDVDWPVNTRRLVIRPAIDDDEEATWSYRRLEATSKWLNTQYLDRSAFAAWFQDPAERANTLVIERGGAVIGGSSCASRMRGPRRRSPATPPRGS